MAAFGRYIYNSLFGIQTETMDEQSEISWTPCAMYDSDRYLPSVSDVLSTKAILLGGTGLPLELINPIIDFAEYWPHTTTSRSGSTTVRAGRNHEDQFIVGIPTYQR